jgi:methyl-accepting chemotaxis protein
MRREDRKHVWINIFQTRLIVRIALYWLVYMVTVANFLFVFRLLAEGPGNPLEQYGRFVVDCLPTFMLFMLLFPILAWDAVKFSHRLVGPLVRFRQTLQDLAAGKQVQPVRLRQGDYLGEMRDEFNAMLETLQRQGVPVLKPIESKEPEEQRCTA